MKKPSIDLSKEGMRRFALHHIEKVILALALAGFVAFFWLGIKTEKFSATDPQKLSQKADEAKSYIDNKDSWTNVADLRIARDNVDEQVANAEKLAIDGFTLDKFGGIAVRSLDLRRDPNISIANPFDMEVDVFTAPVLFQKKPLKIFADTDLDKLPWASQVAVDADEVGKAKEESEFGEQLTELQSLTTRGLRPADWKLDTSQYTSVVTDVVSIRALLKHKEFWKDIDEKLENSFGYFPERDRPEYQLVQVQRKLAGEDGKWEDITLRIKLYRDAFEVGGVPEVVAPVNFDQALCGSIPSMPWIDYREYGTHSRLPARSFDPEMDEAAVDEKTADSSDGLDNRNGLFGNFGQGDDDESTDRHNDDATEGPARRGSDLSAYGADLDKVGPAHEFKVVRFFDLDKKKPNTEYVYRFRIWIADPNNESTAELVNVGGKGNDRDGGRGGTGSGIQGAGGFGSGAGLGGIGGEGGLGDRGGDGRGSDLPGGGKGGGPTGGRGDSTGDGNPKEEYVKTPITDAQKHISVRNRIDRERKERQSSRELKEFVNLARDEFNVDLAASRPTEWVEVLVKIPGNKNLQTYAGHIQGREIRDSNGQYLMIGDPEAKLLVSDWSNKYGTLVSVYRTVRRGDWLGSKISKPLHVLHLVDQSIRKLSDYVFRPKQFVVDMMGGERIPFRSSPVEYRMPGEILIMDLENNEFIVRNSLEDKSEMLNRRFQDDESAEYNQRTPQAKVPDGEEGGRRGGIGGLGG